VDLVTPVELEAITADLSRGFARLGLPEIRMFRTVAMAHMPGDTGAARASAASADDLGALRAFVEQEIQSSDVARLLQRQRARVFAHLRDEIERVAPLRLLEQLDDATGTVAERLDRAATRLSEALADPVALAQADLLPRITIRQHERFWGPFRTWLAVTDGLRFGLPRLVRRCINHTPPGEAMVSEPLIARHRSAAADLLRDEAHALQSRLYARGLPIDRWRDVTGSADGDRFIAETATTLEARADAAAAASAGGGAAVVWMLSTLGRLVPAAFILIGLYVTGRDLLAGNYVGLPLLGHLLAMLTLTFLALQGFAGLFLPSGRRWLGPDIGRQAISEVLTRTVTNWITAYRSDLEADLADLRGPLVALQSTLVPSPTSDEAVPREPLP
jgi:hypothetical protein